MNDCKCYCDPHFTGDQCETSVCSGNGIFDNGKCYCDDEWEGDKCDKSTWCEGHGILNENEECICDPEWTGKGSFLFKKQYTVYSSCSNYDIMNALSKFQKSLRIVSL